MGPNQSRQYGAPGLPMAVGPFDGSPSQTKNQGHGIMSAFRGFWNTSGQTGDIGGSGPVDMTVTGEGCQPITDLGWKKKENKYLGNSSLSERESKDLKDMGKKASLEQFNYKFPENEKHLGLENDSNICYINSAIQVLYHCKPFREQIMAWKPFNKEKYYLINEIQEFFKSIMSSKGNRGVCNHKRFIARIRAGKGEFNNDDHHDSHEFVSWLIDEINMNICEDYRHMIKKKLQSKDYQKDRNQVISKIEKDNIAQIDSFSGPSSKPPQQITIQKDKLADYMAMSSDELDIVFTEKLLPNFRSWVQLMFQGELCTITKCGTCEYQSVREETFMNLSIDIQENVSLSYCLKKFSNKEYLKLGDKFQCDSCLTKQVATRQMMIKKRPKLLLIHLKRFKMNFQTMQHQKLNYRIPFPSLLHIEDNQIYHKPEKIKGVQDDKDKVGSSSAQQQDLDAINNRVDRFPDLNYEYNEHLQSPHHMGPKELILLSGHCHPQSTTQDNSISGNNNNNCSIGDNHAYDLKGIVVHYGSGMNYGHYWSLSRTYGPNPKWIEYDDQKIRVVDDREIQLYYGSPHEATNTSNWHSAYMLMYESHDLQNFNE